MSTLTVTSLLLFFLLMHKECCNRIILYNNKKSGLLNALTRTQVVQIQIQQLNSCTLDKENNWLIDLKHNFHFVYQFNCTHKLSLLVLGNFVQIFLACYFGQIQWFNPPFRFTNTYSRCLNNSFGQYTIYNCFSVRFSWNKSKFMLLTTIHVRDESRRIKYFLLFVQIDCAVSGSHVTAKCNWTKIRRPPHTICMYIFDRCNFGLLTCQN